MPKPSRTPNGVMVTNQGTLIAVANGEVIAEATGPGHFSIYDWSPEHRALMDEFQTRMAALNAAAGEPLDQPLA